MGRLDEKKAKRSNVPRGQDDIVNSAPRVSQKSIPDNGAVISSTDEKSFANEASGAPKRKKTRRRSERRKSSEPRRRRSQKSLSENAPNNATESSCADGAVRRKSRRRSSATRETAHKKQEKSERTCGSHEQRTRRRPSASIESGSTRCASGLRRPSLLVQSPSISRSSFEPSVSSRGSSNSRCSSGGVLQFDPAKTAHLVKRKKDDTKCSYSVATIEGTTVEGSIANLVQSPEKAQVALKSDEYPGSEEDPFALLDSESKMNDDTILHQSVLSLAVSAASSLTGFSDGEDAFSDFDPMDFPDHTLQNASDDSIIPDYLESEKSSRQQHRSGCTRNTADRSPSSVAVRDKHTCSSLVVDEDATCRRRSGSAFRRRSESRKRLHQSFPPISVGKENSNDQGAGMTSPRLHSSMQLADSSASFIALMKNYDDSEGEENERTGLGASLLSLSLNEQPKPRPAEKLGGGSKFNEINRGLGRSFSLRGILRRGFSSRESNLSDDASVGSSTSSVRNFFQPRRKQHSLLDD